MTKLAVSLLLIVVAIIVISSAVVFNGLRAQDQSIPFQGLRFWVKADAGITLENGSVSVWADQSGNGVHASQEAAANRPSMVNVNGKSAVQFDGTDDFLTFALPLNGFNEMTIVLVSAADADLDGGNIGVYQAPLFWNETAQWGTVHLSPFQRVVKFRFGTTQANNLPSFTRSSPIGAGFSLTTSVKSGTTDSLYINGGLVVSQSGKLSTVDGISPTGNLGRGYDDNTYFPGRIAEVIVYSRALSDAERQQVEQYLLTKYLGGPLPNQPPSVGAGPDQTLTMPAAVTLTGSTSDDGSPNGVMSTTWSQVSGSGVVTFSNRNSLTTSATFSMNGTYVLRLTATDGQLISVDDTTISVAASGGGIPAGAIFVSPDMNLQSTVSGYPAGTTFYLTAGVYRLQSINAKSGNTFIGAQGAILSGARLLTNFARQGNGLWMAGAQTQGPASTAGTCMSGYARCAYPEDLFFDNVPLKHVGSSSEVIPGTFYFDYAADAIYFADDPTGHVVETSVLTNAIYGSANNVTIQGLVVEKYANPAGAGTIYAGNGTGWIIQDSEVRYNHGLGIRLSNGAKVLRSYIHHNGQMGINGNGSSIVIDGNEIAFNNYAHYDYSWEAGGTKFVFTTNLVARNNHVHDNLGPGLWTDYNNYYVLFEYNRTSNNRVAGIYHELGFDATIRYNTIENDGFSDYGASLWYGAGIFLNASSNVEIYGNTVINCANGIGASQPNRGSSYVKNLYVHDNMTTQNNGVAAGIVKDNNSFDDSVFTSWENRWANNNYVLRDVNARTFNWIGGWLNKDEWKAAGNNVTGTVR